MNFCCLILESLDISVCGAKHLLALTLIPTRLVVVLIFASTSSFNTSSVSFSNSAPLRSKTWIILSDVTDIQSRRTWFRVRWTGLVEMLATRRWVLSGEGNCYCCHCISSRWTSPTTAGFSSVFSYRKEHDLGQDATYLLAGFTLLTCSLLMGVVHLTLHCIQSVGV